MHQNSDMEVFPAINKRANDGVILLLVQQVHDKVAAMDARLTKHMTEETLELAEEITKLMCRAFPGADPDGHRSAHEAQMKAITDRADFWKKMLFELSKFGLIGFIGWAALALWKNFIQGPQ
jgi:hypothetical protein